MILRRGRFDALVGRQLDLFAADNAALLAEAEAADEAWRRSSRDGAEEAYGDWQLVADAIAEALLDVRETYAATLDGETADAYRGAFDKRAGRRYPRYVGLLE